MIKKYGRLTVIGERTRRFPNTTSKQKRTYLLCKCDCGNEKDIALTALVYGYAKSCGCLNKEVGKKRWFVHGLSKHKLHKVWHAMKARCYDASDIGYKSYGGRGIKICDEWLNDFKLFYDWCIKNGYQKCLQIDRINNDGNYEPSNCRFVTQKINIRNSRQTKLNSKIVAEIRFLKKYTFKTDREIASFYNISRPAVNQVVINKSWQ